LAVLGLLSLAATFLAGCKRAEFKSDPATTAQQPNDDLGRGDLFADMTPASGIIHTYRSGQEAGHYATLELRNARRHTPQYVGT
jgi:hypothetical protein